MVMRDRRRDEGAENGGGGTRRLLDSEIKVMMVYNLRYVVVKS